LHKSSLATDCDGTAVGFLDAAMGASFRALPRIEGDGVERLGLAVAKLGQGRLNDLARVIS